MGSLLLAQAECSLFLQLLPGLSTRETQRGPENHSRGILSQPHSVGAKIERREGGNIGRVSPNYPSAVSSPSGVPGRKWMLCIFDVIKKPHGTPFSVFLSGWRGPQTSWGPGTSPFPLSTGLPALCVFIHIVACKALFRVLNLKRLILQNVKFIHVALKFVKLSPSVSYVLYARNNRCLQQLLPTFTQGTIQTVHVLLTATLWVGCDIWYNTGWEGRRSHIDDVSAQLPVMSVSASSHVQLSYCLGAAGNRALTWWCYLASNPMTGYRTRLQATQRFRWAPIFFTRSWQSPVACLEVWWGGVCPRYISDVHFHKCSKFSIIFFPH